MAGALIKRLTGLILLSSSGLFAAPIFLSVSVFTGDSGTSGYLDFQFNPGDSTAPAATATVISFAPAATLNSPTSTGAVSGDLTSSLAIDNSTSYNDYFVGYTFPATITFLLELSGPAVDSPSGSGFGSTFYFSLYAADQSTALQTTDADGSGSLFSVDLTNAGSTQTNDYSADGASILVTQVPEPGALFLVVAGVAVIAARYRIPE
jgi:hypothetical protein